MAGHALVLYDGACGLCTGIAGMLARRDRHQALTLLPIQGREAAEALARIGAHLPEGWQSDPDSMIVVAEGRMHQRSDAALEIARRLPRPWPWLRALRAVPRP
ncbi:MAG: thiol-disulfide oxidoreductase DCC family protein, partial [Phycisphaerales bacterium]